MSDHAYAVLLRGLKRAGPGSDESTLKALRRLPPLPQNPKILDVGCGMGAHTLVLAAELKTPIVAVDLTDSFLAQLKETALARGLDHLITTRRADMGALPEPPGSVDLIWSENSIYNLGFARGLELWRPLLRPGGLAVVSHIVWLKPDPPAEVACYWKKTYPPMTTVEDNLAAAAKANYEVLDHFIVEQTGWQEEFYLPLKERIASLRARGVDDPSLAGVIEEALEEMDMHERFGDFYGFVFFLMRRPA